jgi:hypothetical protein
MGGCLSLLEKPAIYMGETEHWVASGWRSAACLYGASGWRGMVAVRLPRCCLSFPCRSHAFLSLFLARSPSLAPSR